MGWLWTTPVPRAGACWSMPHGFTRRPGSPDGWLTSDEDGGASASAPTSLTTPLHTPPLRWSVLRPILDTWTEEQPFILCSAANEPTQAEDRPAQRRRSTVTWELAEDPSLA